MRSGPGAVLGAFGFITVAGMTFGTPAQANDVTVGVMTCDTASSFGYVLGSSRDLNCTFVPESGTPEHYAGTISKFGVDIGYVQSAVIVWNGCRPAARVAYRHLWRRNCKRYGRGRRQCAGWRLE
jgi:hypothetical protein